VGLAVLDGPRANCVLLVPVEVLEQVYEQVNAVQELGEEHAVQVHVWVAVYSAKVLDALSSARAQLDELEQREVEGRG
jgi:hypothetical protein